MKVVSKVIAASSIILSSLFLLASLSFAAPKCDNTKKLDDLKAQEYDLEVKLEFAALEDRDAILVDLYAVRDDITKFESKQDKCQSQIAMSTTDTAH
jgi:hypothetical protein